ncbi:MAG: amidophosphoribosyltransferase [Candidatus Hydrogenedentota bacterium]
MSTGLVLTVKNLFFPQFCITCRTRLFTEENGYFCPTCWESTPRVERPFCPVCGRPHPPVRGVSSLSNFPCGQCVKRGGTQPFNRMFAPAVYAEAMAEAIKLLKFHGKTRLVRPIGELVCDGINQEWDTGGYDFLIPVPLHKVRQRQRGFNQSLLLANEIVPFFPGARIVESLRRVRPTLVQSRLKSEAERRENVRGAFEWCSQAPLTGRKVVLVDDVITTAGTVTECAAVLRSAGARQVDVIAAAIAVAGPPTE